MSYSSSIWQCAANAMAFWEHWGALCAETYITKSASTPTPSPTTSEQKLGAHPLHWMHFCDDEKRENKNTLYLVTLKERQKCIQKYNIFSRYHTEHISVIPRNRDIQNGYTVVSLLDHHKPFENIEKNGKNGEVWLCYIHIGRSCLPHMATLTVAVGKAVCHSTCYNILKEKICLNYSHLILHLFFPCSRWSQPQTQCTISLFPCVSLRLLHIRFRCTVATHLKMAFRNYTEWTTCCRDTCIGTFIHIIPRISESKAACSNMVGER